MTTTTITATVQQEVTLLLKVDDGQSARRPRPEELPAIARAVLEALGEEERRGVIAASIPALEEDLRILRAANQDLTDANGNIQAVNARLRAQVEELTKVLHSWSITSLELTEQRDAAIKRAEVAEERVANWTETFELIAAQRAEGESYVEALRRLIKRVEDAERERDRLAAEPEHREWDAMRHDRDQFQARAESAEAELALMRPVVEAVGRVRNMRDLPLREYVAGNSTYILDVDLALLRAYDDMRAAQTTHRK